MLSSARAFFRHCPSCGRRFELRLVRKKLVSSRSIQETKPVSLVPGGSTGNVHTVVEEGVPVVLDVEDFQYSYKCKHCGHMWVEVREETREMRKARS